jgi:AcrR family transcriptional regulator
MWPFAIRATSRYSTPISSPVFTPFTSGITYIAMLKKGRKGITHARGRERRQLLLDAAKALLQERRLDEVALPDVASAADIPKSSAYHFFADLNALYAELAATLDAELNVVLAEQIEAVAEWKDIVQTIISRAATYFRANRSAQQLMFGPTTPPDIKRSSRSADMRHGAVLSDQIKIQFQLSDFPNQDKVFFRAVEIIDLMFGLSMLEFDELRDDMIEEAYRAAVAYLLLYLPPQLPRVIF